MSWQVPQGPLSCGSAAIIVELQVSFTRLPRHFNLALFRGGGVFEGRRHWDSPLVYCGPGLTLIPPRVLFSLVQVTRTAGASSLLSRDQEVCDRGARPFLFVFLSTGSLTMTIVISRSPEKRFSLGNIIPLPSPFSNRQPNVFFFQSPPPENLAEGLKGTVPCNPPDLSDTPKYPNHAHYSSLGWNSLHGSQILF